MSSGRKKAKVNLKYVCACQTLGVVRVEVTWRDGGPSSLFKETLPQFERVREDDVSPAGR